MVLRKEKRDLSDLSGIADYRNHDDDDEILPEEDEFKL